MRNMNGITGLIFILLFFAIVPNLGFFSLPSFLVLSFTFFILLLMTFTPRLFRSVDNKNNNKSIPVVLFALLFYSAIYYGGLYQNTFSVVIGTIFFFLFITILFLLFLYRKGSYSVFLFVVLFYAFLSVWTITNSPKPVIDAFYNMKEAGLLVISGGNPYSHMYTQVYKGIISNYFTYLPFSFIFTLPFTLLTGDPRYSIIFANIACAVLFSRLAKSNNKKMTYLFITVFLFLPRSFYMLEHMYIDPLIFFFFILSIYFLVQNKTKSFLLSLALFFSFKQNLLLLFPLYLKKEIVSRFLNWKKILVFTLPIIFPLYYLYRNTNAFLTNTVYTLFSPLISTMTVKSPVSTSLALPTFLRIFFNTQSRIPYIIGIIIFFLILMFVLRSKASILLKSIVIFFAFHFCLYQSFYNHYFFIGELVFFYIYANYFKIDIDRALVTKRNQVLVRKK